MPSCNFDHISDDAEPFIGHEDYDGHPRPWWPNGKKALLALVFIQGAIIISFTHHYWSARQIPSNLVEVYSELRVISN